MVFQYYKECHHLMTFIQFHYMWDQKTNHNKKDTDAPANKSMGDKAHYLLDFGATNFNQAAMLILLMLMLNFHFHRPPTGLIFIQVAISPV